MIGETIFLLKDRQDLDQLKNRQTKLFWLF